MILELLKNTELEFIVRLATPEFFRAVPFMELFGIGQSLLARSQRDDCARATFERIEPLCRASGIICRSPGDSPKDSNASQPESSLKGREQGEKILRAYFAQILHSDQWFLDFRGKGFHAENSGNLAWTPGPYSFAPSAPFLDAVRALYRGFYLGENSRFDEAIQLLGLAPARGILLEHFGSGDQRAVTFEIGSFQQTFTRVFTSCAESGSRLNPEFAVIGIMLLTLYETLEGVSAPLDVRAAFESADALNRPA